MSEHSFGRIRRKVPASLRSSFVSDNSFQRQQSEVSDYTSTKEDDVKPKVKDENTGIDHKVLVACCLTAFVAGTLFFNLATFLPMFVDDKFNKVNKDAVGTVQISYCIIAFDIASFFCYFIHGKTISLMGRKNAILIGLAIQFITNVLIGLLSRVPSTQPDTFIWGNVFLRLIQGYGDSLSLTAVLSVAILECDTQAEKARIVALVEVFFSLGEASGPLMGSLLYATFDYEGTFVSFGAICFITYLLANAFLPASANGGVVQDELLDGENSTTEPPKIEIEDEDDKKEPFVVGFHLLCDKNTMFAFMAGFIGQIAFQFNASYITLHLKRRYEVKPATAGILAAVQAVSYFIGCFFVPLIPCIDRMPPKLQFIGAMAITGIASSLSGPQRYLLPERLYYVIIGQAILGVAASPLIILCLPEADMIMQLKYGEQMTDDPELEGKFSDLQSALYGQFLAAASTVGPYLGATCYQSFGFRNAQDMLGVSLITCSVFYAIFNCDRNPYETYNLQLKQLEKMDESSDDEEPKLSEMYKPKNIST